MNAPKLRFKDNNQNDYPEWDSLIINNLFDLIKEINHNGTIKNVITNSAEFGLIPQREFFDKDIAVEGKTDKYTVIKKGDFVYNPRKSKSAPYGPFNCYSESEEGIVSPLYFGLRPKYPETSPYLEYYFLSNKWHPYIYNNGAQGGARHDRVGMTNELLLGIPISMPCPDEQQKIASFFSALDQIISDCQSEIDAWEQQKKCVMQQLFSQKIRFKKDDGSEYPEWEEKTLGEVLAINTQSNKGLYGKEEILSVSDEYGVVNQIELQGRSFAGESIDNYKIVKKGQIIYTRSPLKNKPYGIIKIVGDLEGVVSPLYIVNDVLSGNDSKFIYYYFDTPERTNNYLKVLVRMGAKHTMNISNEEWLSGKVCIPCLEEQQKIASCLSVFDDIISKSKQELKSYQNLKKGLMQQMFI